MTVYEDRLVTCDRYGTLQIWNIETGDCDWQLAQRGILDFGFDSHYGVMASAVGHRNKVLIGNIKTAQPERSKAQLNGFPRYQTKCLPFDMGIVGEIKVGPNFLVVAAGDSFRVDQRNIFVTDFPS